MYLFCFAVYFWCVFGNSVVMVCLIVCFVFYLIYMVVVYLCLFLFADVLGICLSLLFCSLCYGYSSCFCVVDWLGWRLRWFWLFVSDLVEAVCGFGVLGVRICFRNRYFDYVSLVWFLFLNKLFNSVVCCLYVIILAQSVLMPHSAVSVLGLLAGRCRSLGWLFTVLGLWL